MEDVRIAYPQTNYSYIEDFPDEQRKEVVKSLGELIFNSSKKQAKTLPATDNFAIATIG